LVMNLWRVPTDGDPNMSSSQDFSCIRTPCLCDLWRWDDRGCDVDVSSSSSNLTSTILYIHN